MIPLTCRYQQFTKFGWGETYLLCYCLQFGLDLSALLLQISAPLFRDCAVEGDELFLDRTGARRFLNRDELSFLCVPIMYDSRVVGILSADKGAARREL